MHIKFKFDFDRIDLRNEKKNIKYVNIEIGMLGTVSCIFILPHQMNDNQYEILRKM